jgi:hypothetical protein
LSTLLPILEFKFFIVAFPFLLLFEAQILLGAGLQVLFADIKFIGLTAVAVTTFACSASGFTTWMDASGVVVLSPSM